MSNWKIKCFYISYDDSFDYLDLAAFKKISYFVNVLIFDRYR